jgi:hypothetical protein
VIISRPKISAIMDVQPWSVWCSVPKLDMDFDVGGLFLHYDGPVSPFGNSDGGQTKIPKLLGLGEP